MKWNNLFFYSNNFERNNSKLELIDLMEKAGFVSQETAGIYSMLSLGVLMEDKLCDLISNEMKSIGFSKIRMNIMQDGSLWEKTNRIELYGEELFKVKGRKGKTFCLAATAEETVTNLYKKFYNRQCANTRVFQIGNKFRDELRARAGLIRGKEFLMKDGYCFNSSKEELNKTYSEVRLAYIEIFKKLNLEYKIVATDNAQIGGSFSEEFLVESSFGEDGWLEVAHIFDLGDTYSKKLEVLDNTGNNVLMGCFGIGVSRLLMVLLEKRRDDFGFWGDDSFSSVDYVITALDYDKDNSVKELTNEIYESLLKMNKSVILDDRQVSAGKKFNDAELIGIRKRIIISSKAILENKFELLDRKTNKKEFFIVEELKNLVFEKNNVK